VWRQEKQPIYQSSITGGKTFYTSSFILHTFPMNNARRSLDLLNYQPYDRLPIVHFGYWGETLRKWVQEGHLPAKDGEFNYYAAMETASSLLGFDFEWYPVYSPNTFLDPMFKPETLQTLPDGSTHFRNAEGVVVLQAPDAGSIPAEIEHLLTDRASWEEHYKPRLQWSANRLGQLPDMSKIDAPLGFHCGSLLGKLRDVLGVVGMSYLMIDDEPLFDEMLQTVGDLCLQSTRAVLATGARFDYAHFWEDICFKNGPLINPDMFAEKIGPLYKTITDEVRKHGIGIVSLDCDGLIDDLIPTWFDNGVNTMFPIEVGTWDASIAPWRAQYGKELRGVGGMNKNVFAQDRAAVDAEIERLKPLIALGGYIPCPDHRIPPTAQWDLVRYYTDQLRAAKI